MKGRFFIQWAILICTFIVAMTMEIAPWPVDFQGFKPAWVVLVLFYWVLSVPYKVSIGTAFVLGVVWDLVLGSILGTHALVLSLFTYLVALNHQLLRNLSFWQQSLLLILFVLAIRLAIFFTTSLIHSAHFQAQEVVGAFVSGIVWPWVFLLLRKIRHQLHLK
ncbi:MAG TPA: rod shape-determining protein MreD [Pasteurellaceae bacterium]|nr:rod shape-determining protein MreD [Pasteurellaceae bacterium]